MDVRYAGFLLLLSVTWFPDVRGQADDIVYAALIDAGSSGSRMHVYSWNKHVSASDGVPQVVEIGTLKTKPGISSLVDSPEQIGGHLRPLVEFARQKVPADKQDTTSIYIMATAGVRLVPRTKRKVMFDTIHVYLENDALSPFSYSRANSRVLSGEEEGAFSWIAVNYNLGFFNKSRQVQSVGLLEMGGASAQIAFIPDGQILADKYPIRVGNTNYDLYVHSYLYYGQDYIRRRIRQYLSENTPATTGLTVVNNPCMLEGDVKNETISGKAFSFRGSSNHTECRDILRTFIWKVSADKCHPSPCTIGNTYQAHFGSSQFYAIKAFVYSASSLKALGPNKELDFSALTSAAQAYCAQSISEAKTKGIKAKYASDTCVMSSYIPLFLRDGLGFPGTGSQVIATNSIDGKNTDWPLGAVLYEAGRRCDGLDMTSKARAAEVVEGPTGGVADDRPRTLMVFSLFFLLLVVV